VVDLKLRDRTGQNRSSPASGPVGSLSACCASRLARIILFSKIRRLQRCAGGMRGLSLAYAPTPRAHSPASRRSGNCFSCVYVFLLASCPAMLHRDLYPDGLPRCPHGVFSPTGGPSSGCTLCSSSLPNGFPAPARVIVSPPQPATVEYSPKPRGNGWHRQRRSKLKNDGRYVY